MSEIEGIEEIAGTVAGIEIEGPASNGAQINSDIAQAVRDARRDLPAPEPLTDDEIAERTARAEEAARANDPLFGKTLVDDGEDVVVTESERFDPDAKLLDAINAAVAVEFPLSDEEVLEAAREMDHASALFDSSAYVAVPEIDDQAVDFIEIAFGGKIRYEAADEDGKALFKKLRLGHPVELRVAGVVAGKSGPYKVTAREEEVVTGKATVKVDTLYVLRPEQL